jgi:hypothetical protein
MCYYIYWPEINQQWKTKTWCIDSNPTLRRILWIWWWKQSFFFLMGWGWVHLVLWPPFGLLYLPRMIDDDDCGEMGGMRTGRGNLSTTRKPAPVPLCSPQIPHDLTCRDGKPATNRLAMAYGPTELRLSLTHWEWTCKQWCSFYI